jgi:hypothetical protein
VEQRIAADAPKDRAACALNLHSGKLQCTRICDPIESRERNRSDSNG